MIDDVEAFVWIEGMDGPPGWLPLRGVESIEVTLR